MAFLVKANDHRDPAAPSRRMSSRTLHLDAARTMEANGTLLFAAATLSSDGNMNGSVLVFDLPTEQEVRKVIESDAYWTTRVWETYSITPIRIAIGGQR